MLKILHLALEAYQEEDCSFVPQATSAYAPAYKKRANKNASSVLII